LLSSNPYLVSVQRSRPDHRSAYLRSRTAGSRPAAPTERGGDFPDAAEVQASRRQRARMMLALAVGVPISLALWAGLIWLLFR
jgi:hypothetical protein